VTDTDKDVHDQTADSEASWDQQNYQ